MEHVTPDELEAFVLGSLELQAAERFRRHLSTCSVCTEQLQHEARFDLLLRQAALAAELEVPDLLDPMASAPGCELLSPADYCLSIGARMENGADTLLGLRPQ